MDKRYRVSQSITRYEIAATTYPCADFFVLCFFGVFESEGDSVHQRCKHTAPLKALVDMSLRFGMHFPVLQLFQWMNKWQKLGGANGFI